MRDAIRALRKNELIFILLLLIAIVVFSMFQTKETISFDTSEDSFTISYTASNVFSNTTGPSMEIRFTDVVSMQTQTGLDYGTLQDGIETEKCRAGLWSNGAFGTYSLCVYNKTDCVIVVETAESGYFVFNFENDKTTEEFCVALRDWIQEQL